MNRYHDGDNSINTFISHSLLKRKSAMAPLATGTLPMSPLGILVPSHAPFDNGPCKTSALCKSVDILPTLAMELSVDVTPAIHVSLLITGPIRIRSPC